MINLKKINTILFDLDGTLVDSNELIIQSFKHTFAHYQPQVPYTRQQLIDMIGPPLKETFRIVSYDERIIEEMIDYYRTFYQKHEFEYITVYPYVLETLEKLSNMKMNLGIVTTKFKESAMPSIKHFNLDKYIKHYSFLGSVKEHKPSPEPIYHVLNKLDNVCLALMVGDNPGDIMAGKNAGIYTCGIEWSLVKERLLATNPDFWIKDYRELISIIEKEI